MIQQNASFNAALGLVELLVAEPQSLLAAEVRQRRIEQIFIQLGRAMFIGVSKGGLIRCHADSEVHQFAQATGESVADLVQRIGVRQLAEQHGNQLRSAAEAFGRPFGVIFLHQSCELQAREMLQQLIKQAHYL